MARRLAVVAGAGVLAPQVVAAAIEAGETVRVFALSPQESLEAAEVQAVSLQEPEAIFAAIRGFGASHLTLAGAVTLSDADRLRLMRVLGAAAQSVGDTALSYVGLALERLTGAMLLGPHEVAPELLAGVGTIAGPEATQQQLAAVRLAMGAARKIGDMDLGQAAVVAGSRIVAVEDIAGTDALIARVASYRKIGLVGGTPEAPLVLAKACKPSQPLFVDLPAIGPDTVVQAHQAGISLLAVEGRRSLLLDRPRTVALANELGIGVLGWSGDD
jgi:UDP-2,3-diacylglucosamine hydrolase